MGSSREYARDTSEESVEPEEPSLGDLSREIARLRRTVLKHGHAQELFQGRVEDAMARLVQGEGAPQAPPVSSAESENDGGSQTAAAPSPEAARLDTYRLDTYRLNNVQQRVLIELGQAARNLKSLVAGAAPAADGDEASPRSVREGLDLLEIRVGNLQRSFGLVPVATRGEPFDDRVHRVHGVAQRSDLPDGQVVEEVLPGYLLHGAVERPALVIVNRLREEADHENSEHGSEGHHDE